MTKRHILTLTITEEQSEYEGETFGAPMIEYAMTYADADRAEVSRELWLLTHDFDRSPYLPARFITRRPALFLDGFAIFPDRVDPKIVP